LSDRRERAREAQVLVGESIINPKHPKNNEGDSQRELERRIFHLKTLHDVSREITFLRSPQEILKNLLMMVMGTFGTATGVAILVNTDENEVEAFAGRGISGDAQNLLPWCAEAHRLEDIQDLKEYESLLHRCKRPTRYGSSPEDNSFSEITVWIPFAVNDHLMGGIGLGGKLSGEAYTNGDRELLATLASQGALTIENARLIEGMKKEESVRTNLARYLSPQIVEQVINEDLEVNLGGDRKEVTVLFSDVREFTRITATRPAEQLVNILNEYFTQMGEIIFENQGSLDKYVGDAIVAVFGSLIDLEDPTQNALRAAVQMMEFMPQLNRRWSDKFDGFSMDIGIGISTGEVFLGNIGSPERMEFTVLGETVNVASRLSQLAKAGQILIPGYAGKLIEPDIKLKELPPSVLKGILEQVQVFEVIYQ
jgi:class 3 adenylate cyclase